MSSDPAAPAPADPTSDAPSALLTDPGADSFPQLIAHQAASGPAGRTVVDLDPAVIELARAAASADAGVAGHVGAFVAAVAEDDIAVTASFTADQPGYGGWQWSVTLAVVGPAAPTVSEVVLLPGEGALLAPAWVPWDQRIRPGDVGVGDLLPPIKDDPRLVPAYLESDDPAVEAVARELGIGRVHVLSREGRVDFAERLHDGPFGPDDEMAVTAPAHCVSCAFFLPLAGSLGQLLGGCGNEFSPADGRVVDAGYGCGAHSETVIEMPARSATTSTVIDEVTLEVHRRPSPERSEAFDAVRGGSAPSPDVTDDEVLQPEPIDLIDETVLDMPDPDDGPAAATLPESPTGELPDAPTGDLLDAPAVEHPDAPTGDLLDEPTVEHPDAPTGELPDAPALIDAAPAEDIPDTAMPDDAVEAGPESASDPATDPDR